MRPIKLFFVLPIMLLVQGCVYFDEDGISTHRYRNCTEYFDAEGIYHCECDENLVDYDDFKPKGE